MRVDGKIDPTINYDKNDEKQLFSKIFPCFRGMLLFNLYYWFLALDVFGWNYFKVNYKIYLGFNHHFSTLS